MSEYVKLTQEEFHRMLTDRFGEKTDAWAFACPSCGIVTTVAEMRDALEANPRTHGRGGHAGEPVTAHDIIGQECIGRILGALRVQQDDWTGPGCDWVAFGLFRGPWEVIRPDGGSTWCFPVAEPSGVAS